MPARPLPVRLLLISAHLLVLLVGTAAAASSSTTPAPLVPAAAPAPAFRVEHRRPLPVAVPVLRKRPPHRPSLRHPASRPHVAVVLRAAPPRHRATVRALPTPVAPPVPAASTARQRLDRAVAQLPGSADPRTRWVLSSAWGSWGTTDWYHDTVYISPAVPARRIYDVVAHEHGHLLSVAAYDGDVSAAVAAMNSWFGGTGLLGAERAADCLARLQGATWTHYTSCDDQHWRDGARSLLGGRRL
jgi:hypothetical protein